jgi:hypothetical protein
MTQFKHRAIIDNDIIEELVNHKIIKINKDGRTESISLIANNAIKDMIRRKKRGGNIWV